MVEMWRIESGNLPVDSFARLCRRGLGADRAADLTELLVDLPAVRIGTLKLRRRRGRLRFRRAVRINLIRPGSKHLAAASAAETG